MEPVRRRLAELAPGFGGRAAFCFAGGAGGPSLPGAVTGRSIALRLSRSAAGRSVAPSGPHGLARPLAEAVVRQLRPWGARQAEGQGGDDDLEVALLEGDEGRPRLLAHLAEGAVLGLAAALGEGFSFPCSDRSYEERNLTVSAGIGPDALERRLAGTGLAGLADAFCRAEVEAGVNGVALAALAAWQSAWGTSRLARGRRNLLGWCAGPDGEAGLSFPTAAASVTAVAPLIRRLYLTPGGRFYAGANLLGMNRHDGVDPLWHHGVAAIWRELEPD